MLTPETGTLAIIGYNCPIIRLSKQKNGPKFEDLWKDFLDTTSKYSRFDWETMESKLMNRNLVKFSKKNFVFKQRDVTNQASFEDIVKLCLSLAIYHSCVEDNKENPSFVDPLEKLKKESKPLFEGETDLSTIISLENHYFIYTIQ